MSQADILAKAEEKMTSILNGVQKDFSRIRTGKASADLLDHCRVNAYGSETPINQMASITVPEPRCIVVTPWDKGTLNDIEKAIQSSDLGVTPSNDGNVIRINLPPLSEDRRKELVKVAKAAAEEGRVHVRNVRRDANEHLKKEQKSGDMSEDELKRAEADVQKLTDAYIKKIDESLGRKEKETLEV